MCECVQLRDKVEDLKEQVHYWRKKAEGDVDTARLGHIARLYGLTRAEAWIFAALHSAGGKTVSRQMLQEAHPGHKDGDDREGNNVDVFVCRIRKKLGIDSVLNNRGVGLFMGREWIDRINRETGTEEVQ